MRAEQSSWSWSRGFAAFADNAPLVAWALIVLGLGRGVMILALRNHLGPSAGAWSVVSVFLNSLRFDLRTATLLAAPSLVLSVVAARWNVDRLAIKLRASIAVTFAAITAVLVAIDIAYFKEFGNQFDHFLFGLVFDDRVAIARTVWSSYPVAGVFAAGILALAVAAKTAPPFVAAPRFSADTFVGVSRSGRVLLTLAAVVLVVCCARGSLGRRPAQMKTAAVTSDDFLNRMVVNPYHCLATAATDYISLRRAAGGLDRFLPGHDVRAAAKRYFHTPRDLQSLDLYALHRAPGAAPHARHVIVIVMESYSAWPTLPQYRSLHLADGLNGLAANGIAVRAFLPAGPGTIPSLGAIITGLPDLGVPLSYEPSSRHPFPTSLPAIFRRLGYRTRFFYGGYLAWQRIGDFARAQGFDEVHGGGEMGNWLEGKEWGVDDEHLFDFALTHIPDDVPSFDLILSVSNHPPFNVDLARRGEGIDRLPPEIASLADSSVDLNALAHFRYADRRMGNFVRAENARLSLPLFAITGDHYGRKFLNTHPTPFERLAVPLVLFGPAVLDHRRIDGASAGSHIDIVPTVVNLAAPRDFEYAAFGHDLLVAESGASGLGTGAAITAGDVVDLTVKGGERPTSIAAREVDALRGRYNDLHALGWWWVRKGAALPDPKNVKAAAVEGR